MASESVALPAEFQGFIADGISPDGKFCVIYPKRPSDDQELTNVKNYLIQISPFQIIKELPVDSDTAYSERKNHASFSAVWNADSTCAAIVLEGRWGPANVFVICLDGKAKVTKMFELTELISAKADPLLKKAVKEYNGFYLLEDSATDTFLFNKKGELTIDLLLTDDPKEMGGDSAWNGTFKGVFNCRSGTITEAKVEKTNAP